MRAQLSFSVLAFSLCASLSLADRIPPSNILWGAKGAPGATLVPTTRTSNDKPAVVEERATCTNDPNHRDCWVDGFSVAADFDNKTPPAGKIVKYNLEITESTCNPDGANDVPCLKINNQYPGPTLVADWGDTLTVTLKNSIRFNGTGIHWHGIRQKGSTGMDGVPGITECPLAPGQTKTYSFKLTQYGTTWYHSHYSAQYGLGAIGGLQINGPATQNYDIDLGTYMVGDWYNRSAWQVDDEANANLNNPTGGRPPPNSDNILINGTNKGPNGTGKYGTVSLTKGKKYLLRLINPSVDNQIRVQLDNHKFTVITSDLVPVEPITTNWLLLGIGQRYNVIIDADQDVGNYWFRAVAETGCSSFCNNPAGGLSIFSYAGAPAGNPTSVNATKPVDCNEPAPLAPHWKTNIPSSNFTSQAAVLPVSTHTETVQGNGKNIVYWGINTTAIDVDWEKPILSYVKEKNFNFPKSENLIEIPTQGTWTYWIVQQVQADPANGIPRGAPPVPHPIHLHGHDFWVLGQGAGAFSNSSISALNFNNPPRRDVAFLPNGGWLVMAFPADNPGAWLMHCHIAWHIGEGLGVQFLESKDQFPAYPADYDQTCADWSTYYATAPYKKTDSGL